MKILPDTIPEDTHPLDAADLIEDTVNYKQRELHEGKNMFVTLLTGQFLIGRVEWIDEHRFTVGHSEPIRAALIETAREV